MFTLKVMMASTIQTVSKLSGAPLPPLVHGLPGLGNALDLFRNPTTLFVKAYQELGPVFRVRVPGREYTVMAGPEATLFLAQGEGFSSPSAWRLFSFLFSLSSYFSPPLVRDTILVTFSP